MNHTKDKETDLLSLENKDQIYSSLEEMEKDENRGYRTVRKDLSKFQLLYSPCAPAVASLRF